ncbi:putative E3 ubiquitin-protein ligase MGRN1 isoform X2 [Tubulanus polymorphus]|uniref:putative E3 ubiquitin-protein ligase MGRN1 isoform X2 n=1 Tax=Tubulanus polymorphus TaxID=672921 RepID=UPI003DA63F41
MKMGAFISSDNAGVEEVNIPNVNAYRYPPKCGNYFGSHFIMGGERFDTIQPEAYLFGENQDLNFLGKRPVPFPYPAPQGNEPTKTLRSLVNIRKDSLRFVKSQNHTMKPEDSTEPQTKYNIEFTFDADARCAITIFYFTSEEVIDGRIIYHPRDSAMNSETFHYKRGANQTFSQPTHVIDPSKFSEEELQYNLEAGTIPIVIQCVVEDEEDHIGHAHMTFGVVDKNSDNTYTLKPLKQKQMVDGLCYLLQEIYGIENKNCELTKSNQEDEFEDTGSECVICMSESRDTLILPCRHLCLCSACANNLRYQANNCPICRAPFRALLQIRAMKKKSLTNNLQPQRHHQSNSDDDDCCSGISQEGVPHGYEAVSLIEALNGPPRLPPPPPNPLHLPPEGLPPPGRPSLLNSPSDSPPVDRKKALKRQPSVGSTSLREAVVPEEAEYAGESESSPLEESDEIETGRGTPEVVMLGQAPDPSKSPGKQPIKFKLPKVRYPKAAAAAAAALESDSSVPEHETDGDDISQASLEIVDEVQRSKEDISEVLCQTGAEDEEEEEDDDDDEEDDDDEDDDDDDLLDDSGDPRSSTPDSDYTDPTSLSPGLRIVFRPAAHTKVLYDREDDCDSSRDESDVLTSGQHESLSLPGTPLVSEGSTGSSSSGSSRRMLLNPTVHPDEERLHVYRVDE